MQKSSPDLDRGAVGSAGEEQHGLDDLQVAAERLEEGKPVLGGDVGLAPVVQALGAPQDARRGRVDAALHVLQGRAEADAGNAELDVQLEKGGLLFAAGVGTPPLCQARQGKAKQREMRGDLSRVESSRKSKFTLIDRLID